MIQLNARFLIVNAGLLSAVLSVACGSAPAGPSDVSDVNEAVATSAQTSTTGSLATTQGVSRKTAPSGCHSAGRLMLEATTDDKLTFHVTSNYVATSKACPSLTWTISTKHDFTPDVDKLGRDFITVQSNQPDGAPVASTVTAFGPNGSASVQIFLR